jgi:hypothetical protein
MPSRHPTRARWKEVSFGLKEFQHAYLTGDFVAERLSWGLYQGEELVGVAVFGVPSHPAVLTNVFPDLEPYTTTLVLSRFVLLDKVPANGRPASWGRCFAPPRARGCVGWSASPTR